MNSFEALEFDIILSRLSEHALTEAAKAKCLSLKPCLAEREAKKRLDETTQARRLIEQAGTPPLTSMTDIPQLLTLAEAGDMLLPDQLEKFLYFQTSCKRLRQYLQRAESTCCPIAFYGRSIDDLSGIGAEIERCIRGGQVDDRASSNLYDIRRQKTAVSEQIKAKLNSILSRNKAWFSDSFVSVRGGHFTLPVKREYKNNVPGTVIVLSNTGGTCFVEPSSVSRLQQELDLLELNEDNEIRKILYTLTSLITEALPSIRRNTEAMETLDFLFAKGKYSIASQSSPVTLTAAREIRIKNACHPLLDRSKAVPLDFELCGDIRGVVITGPNTGGKTVALKTIGLLSLMAQSGLHVPADERSVYSLHNLYLCDIGDGQSISENLSTFSSHMKNVIEIIKTATEESLVLLDELGSGTDPAEGMGLAVAVLEELCGRGCLFVATTHYPEVKTFAAAREGLQNARMAFDRQNIAPLYRLEVGEAGESCALYIAERLGMPEYILANAEKAAYNRKVTEDGDIPAFIPAPKAAAVSSPRIVPDKAQKETSDDAHRFNIGDSVFILPKKEIGIVCAKANDMGEVGVQVKKEKKRISHKRLRLHVPASELYPEDYDFSVIFDTVANRKARHMMNKRHMEGNEIIVNEDDKAGF